MSSIIAKSDIAASLESQPLYSVCEDYVNGYCANDQNCNKSHKIVLLDGTSVVKDPITLVKCNHLLYEPRKGPKRGESAFDSDGPGRLCTNGPRHDNDYEEIGDIKILPTTDEIICLKRPYMPTRDPNSQHRLPLGPERLLDIMFRQLRYDSIEPIIDPCYHAMQQLATNSNTLYPGNYPYNLETPRGNKYSLFRNAKVEGISFHSHHGAVIRLSYACPTELRGKSVSKSTFFESGMLCALIGLETKTAEITTTFFEVHLRQSTDSMLSKTGNHTRSAVQVTFPYNEDVLGLRRCAYYLQGLIKASFVIVSLPNVLLPGFAQHLDRVQKLSVWPDFAFSSTIAPTTIEESKVALPAYAEASNFKYDLRDIQRKDSTGPPLTLSPMRAGDSASHREATLENLKNETTLDEGQALALYENLSRELAFTQGPPGTGKTYLGVSLAQVLLASQPRDDVKPILVTCMTNHALDDFMKDLLSKGIKNIVRLGSSSKEEWTTKHKISEVTKDMRTTKAEGHKFGQLRSQLDRYEVEGNNWAEELSSGKLGWMALKDHMKANHPDIFEYFTSLEYAAGDVDLRRARKFKTFAYQFWIEGGDLKNIDMLIERLSEILGTCGLPKDESPHRGAKVKEKLLAELRRNSQAVITAAGGSTLWALSLEERQALHASWKNEMSSWKICEAFAEIHRRHQAAVDRKRDTKRSVDNRCLEQQKVICGTTTGVVRNYDLLSQLGIRVVILEEASEILDSHIVCALFRTVEHKISIGDPEQLRPSTGTMELAVEHNDKYRMNESLFERFSRKGSSVPFSRLTVQRRMHPEIADISRAGTYPYLIDHETTKTHPPITGMIDRLYWLNHEHLEENPDKSSPYSKSHCNRFEVDFCAAFVQYLIEQNGYGLGDIVILTPYNGQLAALTSRLQQNCSVRLTDADREALIKGNLLPEEEYKYRGRTTDVCLNDLLRIATIDNFQGEEAKIIIFSAVRSNTKGQLGFLKDKNRINVCISRARDGFYILGNAKVMNGAAEWSKLLKIFQQKNKIGPSFPASRCVLHHETAFQVFEPEQFALLPKCTTICDEELPCGHRCKSACHPLAMHNNGQIICDETCGRVLECGHPCMRQCSEACGPCYQQLPPMFLSCGHDFIQTCNDSTKGVMPVCRKSIEKLELPCGHIKSIECAADPEARACTELCGAYLDCGHYCPAKCGGCGTWDGHSKCNSLCGAMLDCGHECVAKCHKRKPCPPCQVPCEQSCQHGSCDKPCSSICEPCGQTICEPICPHQSAPNTTCCLPSELPACNQPCDKVLSCGSHLCPGLCSEYCLTTCIECLSGVPPQRASYFQLRCGHSFTTKELDAAFQLHKFFQLNPEGLIAGSNLNTLRPDLEKFMCPECRQPVRGTKRYALLEQLPSLSDKIDRLYAEFRRKLSFYVDDMFAWERHITDQVGFESFCKKFKNGPLGGCDDQTLVTERSIRLKEVQEQITKYRDEVVVPFEESFLCLASFLGVQDNLLISKSPFKLRYDLAYYQCRLIILEDAFKTYLYLSAIPNPTHYTLLLTYGIKYELSKHLQGEIHSMEAKFPEIEALRLNRLEVELRIAQACMHTLYRKLQGEGSGIDLPDSLQRILHLCILHPRTAGTLRRNYEALKDYILGAPGIKNFHELYAKNSVELYDSFKEHQLDRLAYCRNGHPFCYRTYDLCPECGSYGEKYLPRPSSTKRDIFSGRYHSPEPPELYDSDESLAERARFANIESDEDIIPA